MIYLDNAATTQITPAVVAAMLPYLTDSYGNAGSLYKLGRDSALAIEKARAQVAGLMGAKPEQIIFTSGGSESNSLVFHGLLDYLSRIGKKTVVVSATEHDSVLKAANALRIPLCRNTEMNIKDDFDIRFLRVDPYGEVVLDDLEEMLVSSDVGLVSVMYVNNETGAINNVREIGRLCKEHGVLFHTDCVQAAGCHKIDVREMKCDFASISSHKIHGCKGVGALFVKDKNILSPIIYGGTEQEYGLRGGTENVAGIVGFGVAAEIAATQQAETLSTVTYYKKRFFQKVSDTLRNNQMRDILKVNGHLSNAGKTLNIRFDDVDGETLVLMLDSKGICISSGSACRSHESEPSHVLRAMGLEPDEARDSVRISFSDFNSISEIDNAAETIAEVVVFLRKGLQNGN